MNGIVPAIERLCDVVDPLSAAVFAGLLAAVVGAINIFFRRWLTPGQLALMWGLVLIRLLLPTAPASPFSLQRVVAIGTEVYSSPPEDLHEPVARATDPARAVRTAAVAQHVEATPSQVVFAAPASTPSASLVGDIYSLLMPIWFFVGVGGLTWTLASYWRFCRRVEQAPRCNDARLLDLWQSCCKAARVNGANSLVLFDGVEQPAVMGVFQRTLLLPGDAVDLSDQELRMIMFHELAHVRRWDIPANWLLVLIRAVHWWNPIYWLAAARFRSLSEQACDAFVIRRLEKHSVVDYRELLLKLAQRRPTSVWRVTLPASILGLFPGTFRKAAIHRRIKSLRTSAVVRTRWHRALAYGALLLVAVGGLSDAKSERAPTAIDEWKLQGRDFARPQARSYIVEPAHQGPQVTRDYNIEPALRRIASDTTSAPVARQKMDAALSLILPQATRDHGTYTINEEVLTVTAPASVHEVFLSALDAWAESGLAQIVVDSQILTAERDYMRELGLSWEFLEAFSAEPPAGPSTSVPGDKPFARAEGGTEDYVPVVLARLDERQAAMFKDAAKRDATTRRVQMPRVTLFTGQSATIVDCVQQPFVVGVRPVGEAGEIAVEPKVAVIESGSKVTLRATLTSDQQQVRLQQTFHFSSVAEVNTATTSFHGQTVTIQIPRVNRRVLELSSDIAGDQTLIVGFLPTGKDPQFNYFLITARILSDSDSAE